MNKNHIIFLISLAVIASLAFMLFDQEKTTDNTKNQQTNNSTQNQATTTQYKSYTTDPEKEEYMIPKVSPKKYSELTPLPEDFEEFIISSGTVRFGVPRDMEFIHVSSSTHKYSHPYQSKYLFSTQDVYETSDFKTRQEPLFMDGGYIVKSGYRLSVVYKADIFPNTGFKSRCDNPASRPGCLETNLLEGWSTYRENRGFFEQEAQYSYVAEPKNYRNIFISLLPPQTADVEETEALFTKILKTVELIEPEEEFDKYKTETYNDIEGVWLNPQQTGVTGQWYAVDAMTLL
ncbi:MAG: hypothetical protein H6779_02695 [Candidatus Nomurabacteria bacterium]|nr:hypothetical protein [Candidatus Nomurabacteria bacterium]USN87298.1 MAG: hypothetical protein H6779_02695 [Candidatus Nomurabacteria bacterium]